MKTTKFATLAMMAAVMGSNAFTPLDLNNGPNATPEPMPRPNGNHPKRTTRSNDGYVYHKPGSSAITKRRSKNKSAAKARKVNKK